MLLGLLTSITAVCLLDSADFKGEVADSFIDGSKVRYYPTQRRRLAIALSLLPIAGFILAAIGIVASIYLIRYAIQPTIGPIYGQVLASLTNTVQIQYMNKSYGCVAKALTNRENYRTDTEVHYVIYFAIVRKCVCCVCYRSLSL